MLMITLTVMAFVISAGIACDDDDVDNLGDEIGDTVGTVTNGDDESPTSAPTEGTATETTPGAGGGATTPDDSDTGDGRVIEIESENTEFSKDEITATTGTFTIRHENKDDGVLHNIAIYEAEDDTSETLFATELEPGPSTQTLEVEGLEPGEYYFQCDSHPSEMNGTLTVE
jgi:plastocyanin